MHAARSASSPRPSPATPPAALAAPAEPRPVAWAFVAPVLVAKLILHLFALTRYGYFRDELYYLASTEHLAWGYPDHPPLSIALLAMVRALLGDSLPALRLVPLLAGLALVALAAALAARLGGGRAAQALAALAVAAAPVHLALDHYYSMNALDGVAWAVAALLLARLTPSAPARAWLPLGVALGVGLLNKLSVLWLGTGLAVALVATPYRRALRRPGPWLAAAVALALLAPHVAWQVANDWPTLEFMRNVGAEKMLGLAPLVFLGQAARDMGPAAALLAVAGLFWGLRRQGAPAARALAVAALVVLAILLANRGSRPSYFAAAHVLLVAPGAVAFGALGGRAGTAARAAIVVLAVLYGAVAAPLALPLLAPATLVRYARTLGVEPGGHERTRPAELPQQFADMFGWEEMATKVARAYQALPAEERERCAVVGQNYGEAGALDVFGRRRGLPPALSPHNAYWQWGTRGHDGRCALVLGDDRESLEAIFDEVVLVDTIECRWCMPYERDLPLWRCREPKVPLADLWRRAKRFV